MEIEPKAPPIQGTVFSLIIGSLFKKMGGDYDNVVNHVPLFFREYNLKTCFQKISLLAFLTG